MFGMAFGFGLGAISLTLTAVHNVRAEETGIASAILNSAQQIGVALGLASVAAVSVAATEGRMQGKR
ncbi:hypothetical protein L284_16685 [Novosphingobium lindaniclasticum LE124]|uniref:Major facilitator superfamily (MFS) profile domain-containing protein n=1 Tax=Novosphingobium lindaniclasticum LE124 TaxID=1096930 RepID=T0HF08_9SPHN|nr:hypothetical protein L284_16685 [Novosphingobium lindaniclasticum LE124]